MLHIAVERRWFYGRMAWSPLEETEFGQQLPAASDCYGAGYASGGMLTRQQIAA